MAEPQRVALDRLLFPRPVSAGMDLAVIGLWVAKLRKGADPCDPPIVIRPVAGTPFYRVSDGRHRVCAAIAAGRTEIEYVLDREEPTMANRDRDREQNQQDQRDQLDTDGSDVKGEVMTRDNANNEGDEQQGEEQGSLTR
jgi:hypothetical protein